MFDTESANCNRRWYEVLPKSEAIWPPEALITPHCTAGTSRLCAHSKCRTLTHNGLISRFIDWALLRRIRVENVFVTEEGQPDPCMVSDTATMVVEALGAEGRCIVRGRRNGR